MFRPGASADQLPAGHGPGATEFRRDRGPGGACLGCRSVTLAARAHDRSCHRPGAVLAGSVRLRIERMGATAEAPRRPAGEAGRPAVSANMTVLTLRPRVYRLITRLPAAPAHFWPVPFASVSAAYRAPAPAAAIMQAAAPSNSKAASFRGTAR